jgi:xanthine dehydrogenase molybdopterin-binding subunit B
MDGVVRILTYRDIPGENQIGGIIADEPLFAEDHVHFCGMPIALVVAETVEQAKAAVKKIQVEIDEVAVITDRQTANIFLKDVPILTGRNTCISKHREPMQYRQKIIQFGSILLLKVQQLCNALQRVCLIYPCTA